MVKRTTGSKSHRTPKNTRVRDKKLNVQTVTSRKKRATVHLAAKIKTLKKELSSIAALAGAVQGKARRALTGIETLAKSKRGTGGGINTTTTPPHRNLF